MIAALPRWKAASKREDQERPMLGQHVKPARLTFGIIFLTASGTIAASAMDVAICDAATAPKFCESKIIAEANTT
jgi:hypothetical protein